MTKDVFIEDLKRLSPKERFDTILLVKKKEVRTKKNGVRFLSLVVGDQTGSIDCKIWDNVNELSKVFKADDFIRAKGRMQVYNSQHQAIITWLRLVPEKQVQLSHFMPHTVHDIDLMYEELLATVDSFSNPHLKRLLGVIFRDPEFARAYKRTPAAKGNHHAKIGGLLEHVTSLLRLSKLVASHYHDLDGDLLASGVLLHDAGKVFELTSDRSFDYTDEGRLLGHIPMGSAWLERHCDQIPGFPPRLKTLLLHLVLSHHGKLEFGSPQLPQFAEALALHFLDDLDAKLEMMRQARADSVEGSSWSSFHKALGRFVLDTRAFLGEEESRDGNEPLSTAVEEAGSAVEVLPAKPVEVRPDPEPPLVPEPPASNEKEPDLVEQLEPRGDESTVSTPPEKEPENAPQPPPLFAPLPLPLFESLPPNRESPTESTSTDKSLAEPERAVQVEEDGAVEVEEEPKPRVVLRPKPAQAPNTVRPVRKGPPAPSPPLPMQATLESFESAAEDIEN